ncbi:MAG: hypothetical protein BM485_04155 [Desulfobulbaceae bacterium DB1]|nr:MAG: hypothetical protein BM485_04155 [Desulfobulbaceae bacterium DB1]
MQKNALLKFLSLTFFSLTTVLAVAVHPLWAKDRVKVGIFQNKPIVYDEGGPKGLFVEVLDHVAAQENWQLEYVTCELKDCLELIKENKIDLMTSLGQTPEREADFLFSREPVWTFWGTVYSRDLRISGILDLKDKKIGVRRKNKITEALQELLTAFQIPVHYVEFDNYEEAFAAFGNNEVDAVAVNNTYGFDKQKMHSFHKTPIVFHPFSAYFAVARHGGNPGLLRVIDGHVARLKTDEGSIFHAFEQKWFAGPPTYWTPKRIAIFSITFLVFSACLMAFWRYRSLVAINKELTDTIAERKKAEEALQLAQSGLERRVAERTAELRQEIESRTTLEKQLQKERDFLDAVLNNIEDGVAACNEKGVLTLFNRAARRFHGLSEKPIPADEWARHYDLFLADGVTRMEKKDIPLFRSLHGEFVKDYEMVIAPEKGKKRFVLASSQPLVDAQGNRLGAVASMHDVTERKRAEDALKKAHEELEKKVELRTRELRQSNEDLAREIVEREKIESQLRQAYKMEAIGTLAGGIAHDFNNILTAILGYAELSLIETTDDNPAKADIEQIFLAANRAKELVRQILTFSRKGEEILQPVKPSFIINEALKLMRASLPSTIEIREEIDPACGFILANPTHVHQVLVNLCTNALHAMEDEKGVVTVTLARIELRGEDILDAPGSAPGPFIALTVRDTGQGMSAATVQRIFEPYFTTKEIGKGSGMGLAVVHGIVQRCGGFITVESSPGQGSTFTVFFPAIAEESNIAVEVRQPEPLPTGRERLLIVDDEAGIAGMYKMTLERLGYDVTAKTDSKETLELFRSFPGNFDLLLTDQTMPHLSGFELAEEVLKIRPDIPIILCTGYSSRITEEKAVQLGIKRFAMKPVERKVLAKMVREVLDARER